MGSPGNGAAVPTTPLGRRALLGGAAAGAAAVVLDRRPAHASPVRTDPFALGVASGDPLPWSVILWTRLVGTDGAAIGGRDVDVRWEVARDPGFRRRRAAAVLGAEPDLGRAARRPALPAEAARDPVGFRAQRAQPPLPVRLRRHA